MPPWGKRCHNRGFLEVADFAYQRAVESDPDTKDYLQNLMEINEERGNYKRAIECAKRLTKLDPNNGKLRAQLMGWKPSK